MNVCVYGWQNGTKRARMCLCVCVSAYKPEKGEEKPVNILSVRAVLHTQMYTFSTYSSPTQQRGEKKNHYKYSLNMTLARKIYLGKLLGISSENGTCFGMESCVFVVFFCFWNRYFVCFGYTYFGMAGRALAKFQQNPPQKKSQKSF